MPTATKKKTIISRSRAKAKPMTKVEMFQKMLDDQKFIREAIQNGVSFQELKDKYGYKFATVPDPKNRKKIIPIPSNKH